MSLSRILMNQVQESANDILVESDDVFAYDHEDGARLIAMETAEALHDVFLESFYGVEQLDLLAIREGVTLENSLYGPIVEGIAFDACEKVKNIIKSLWEKTKEFFKSIMKFVQQFLLTGREFFNKYDKELSLLTNLPGFKYKMYEYDHEKIDNAMCVTMDRVYDIMRDVAVQIDVFYKGFFKATMKDALASRNGEKINEFFEEHIARIDDLLSDDYICDSLTDGEVREKKDFNEYIFGMFRNGAKNSDDKKEIEITNVYKELSIVRDYKPESIKRVKQDADEAFNNMLDCLNKIRELGSTVSEKLEKLGGENVNISAKMSEMSMKLATVTSKTQSYQNNVITAWKNVVKERDSEYKRMALSALSYARKNKN